LLLHKQVNVLFTFRRLPRRELTQAALATMKKLILTTTKRGCAHLQAVAQAAVGAVCGQSACNIANTRQPCPSMLKQLN